MDMKMEIAGSVFKTAAEKDSPAKLEIKNLAVYYSKFRALADINLSVHEKRITAIIGPSGCGKSTLLRSFNRMNDLTPGCRVQGEINLDGGDIYAPGVDVVEIRRRVGMVFQRPNPFPKSIYDNVAFGPRLYGIRRRSDLNEIVERPSSRPRCGRKSRTSFTSLASACRVASNNVCVSPAPWPSNQKLF